MQAHTVLLGSSAVPCVPHSTWESSSSSAVKALLVGFSVICSPKAPDRLVAFSQTSLGLWLLLWSSVFKGGFQLGFEVQALPNTLISNCFLLLLTPQMLKFEPA